MASLFKRDTSKYWYASWRSGDKRNLVSTKVPIKGAIINGIKETPTQARTRAQIIADGYEAADKEGIHSARVKTTMAHLANETSMDVPSVKKFLDEYIESRKGQLVPGSIINAKTAIKLFLASLGKKAKAPITSVTRADVKAFIDEQLKHVRHGTVKKYIAAISPAFMSALDKEIINKTPFFRISVPKYSPFEKTPKQAFSREEIATMLQSLPPEWRSMVILSIYTGGQRLGDIATLTWDQVDMKEQIITITTGKTGKHLRIPMVAPLIEHLNKIPRLGTYLHPIAAERYQRNGASNLSTQFKRELEYIGVIPPMETQKGSRARNVSPKSFHCLRATAATLLHTSGVGAALAREVVGHDSEATHQLYIRPDDEQRRAALEKLADAMTPPSPEPTDPKRAI